MDSHKQGEAIKADAHAGSGGISIVSSYGTLFVVALRACERARQIEQEAVVAVVFSALAIEGFLNQMVCLASHWEGPPPIPGEVQAFAHILNNLEKQRASIETKLQVAHYILTHRELDRGSLPYQDFDLLMKLRNALAHSRPERFEHPLADDGTLHPLVQQLVNRGVMEKPLGGAPQLRAMICRYDVGRWAYNLGIEMMNFLIETVPESRFKERLRFSASNFPTIEGS
jgi:hypothetical protein